jgi:ribosomal protein S18 acetylase RimI-like enzyme
MININKDIIVITYKIFKGEELYELCVDYNKERPYEKLDDLVERIHYFNGECSPSYGFKKDTEFNYFCAMDEDKIVGMLKFKTGGSESLWNPGYNNWVSFISVDPEYRNRGIAKKLIRMLFEFANENKYSVLQSRYSDDGLKYIKKEFNKVASEYDIDFKDSERN